MLPALPRAPKATRAGVTQFGLAKDSHASVQTAAEGRGPDGAPQRPLAPVGR